MPTPLEKIKSVTRRLSAQSDKWMMETYWYPIVFVAALVGAAAVVLKLFR